MYSRIPVNFLACIQSTAGQTTGTLHFTELHDVIRTLMRHTCVNVMLLVHFVSLAKGPTCLSDDFAYPFLLSLSFFSSFFFRYMCHKMLVITGQLFMRVHSIRNFWIFFFLSYFFSFRKFDTYPKNSSICLICDCTHILYSWRKNKKKRFGISVDLFIALLHSNTTHCVYKKSIDRFKSFSSAR